MSENCAVPVVSKRRDSYKPARKAQLQSKVHKPPNESNKTALSGW